jgi:NAD(P)-dependent dehydrogenase (short-subunit alcohol dehydrogenase family)
VTAAAGSAGDGRVVVITGASGGIGAALARRLGRDGHRLVLGARRLRELQKVADDAGGGTDRARAVPADVTSRGDVERLREAALEAFGGIDVWINNAGRGITRPVLELTDEDVDDMMRINVKSALYGMQTVVPYFVERGRGHVVNVSSFLGRVPLAMHRSAYSAAKAALNSLTANLRMDLRTRAPDVRVSLVMPGLVRTDFARNAGSGDAGGSEGAVPLPRASGPALAPQSAEEVAEAIAGLLDAPVPEAYTNPAQRPLVERYYADVAAFEAGFGY